MKKVLLALVGVALIAGTVSAQEKKTTWGIRAGLNVANMQMKADNVKIKGDSRASFNAGVSLQQAIAPKAPVFLETGLFLSGNGTKQKAFGGTMKMTPLYLKLPVAFSYHFNIKDIVSIQPYVGIYYGLGLGGKQKWEDGDYSEEYKLFKDENIEEDGGTYTVEKTMKRSDFGLRFGAGFAFKSHYYIGLGYDLGLVNTAYSSEDAEFGTLKNKAFYISVGYNF